MKKTALYSCLMVVGILGVLAAAAQDKKIDSDKRPDVGIKGVTTTYFQSHVFDNCRFFAPRNPSGGDVGNDGWLKITAKGRRDYLASIDPRRCALVVVDLQMGMLGKNSWPEAMAKYNQELADAWNQRMKEVVVPNVNRLTDFFRKQDLPIIFLQLGTSGIMKELKTQFGPKEFLVTKYSAGAFATSPIDNVLKEFGVSTIFFVGTDTACCFMATVDEAYDRSYQTIIIEDGCIASRPELHDAAIKIWAYRAFVRSTDQVIGDYPWGKWIDPSVARKN